MAKLGLDDSEYQGKLEKDGTQMESWGSKAGKIAKTAAKGVAVAATAAVTAAVAVGTAIVKGASETADYGDSVDKMSQKLGMSAEAYQEWDAVLQHNGTSIETMQASMKTLASAAETDSAAFEKLGLSTEEIGKMSQQDLFEATITALQNVESETERTYLAGKLLGRGATELGPLLNQSAEETQAMRDRVHELGGVMSDDAVKAAAKYKDSLQDMKTAFSGLKRGLTGELLPGITQVMDGLTEIFTGKQSGVEKIKKGLESLTQVFKAVIPKCMEIGKQIISALVDTLISNLPQIFSLGTEILVQIATGLVQALPQLIAALPQVVTAIKNAFIQNAPALKEAGIQLLKMLGEGILSVLGWLLEALGKIVLQIRDYFVKRFTELRDETNAVWKKIGTDITDRMSKIKKSLTESWEAIKQNVSNTWTGMKNTVQSVNSSLSSALTSAWDNLKSSASNHFAGIKTTITNAMKSVQSSVSNILSSIYKAFTNGLSALETSVYNIFSGIWTDIKNTMQNIRNLFSSITFTFPHIKLPHFSWSWIDLGGIVSIPRIYVDWYKKAYDNPLLFTSPTVLGTASGLKGFGDGQGGEMVYGHDNLMRDISNAVSGATPSVIINVYPQKGQSEAEIAKQVQKEFVRWDKQRKAAAFA